MSDRVEPALTAEEWRDGEFDSHYGGTKASLHIDHKGRVFAHGDPDGDDKIVILNESYDFAVLHKLIALANDALPDDDKRKITRARLDAFRAVLEDYEFAGEDGMSVDEWAKAVTARELLDALESLLPPE